MPDSPNRTQAQQPAAGRADPSQQNAKSEPAQGQGQGQAGSGADRPQQMGEGSYEGTRDYNQRTERYLEKADVEADAKAAKPRSEQEARELEQAEEEGKSHSRGEH